MERFTLEALQDQALKSWTLFPYIFALVEMLFGDVWGVYWGVYYGVY